MIKTNKSQLMPPAEPLPATSVARSTQAMFLDHTDRILSEVPRVLRRVGQFFLVMMISIPVFLAGLLVVLWHLAH